MSVAASPVCHCAAASISSGWVPERKNSPAAQPVNQLVANAGNIVLPGFDISRALPLAVAASQNISGVPVRATNNELRTNVSVALVQYSAYAVSSPNPAASVE